MNIRPNSEHSASKRSLSPDSENNNERAPPKIMKFDSNFTEGKQEQQNYKSLETEYVHPRYQISIYAPGFKYGPNRRYDTDDDTDGDESDAKKDNDSETICDVDNNDNQTTDQRADVDEESHIETETNFDAQKTEAQEASDYDNVEPNDPTSAADS